MKIFLVEDEVFALRTLCKKVRDLSPDYEIAGTASDGVEALPLILEARPEVVITDIRMSRMDGLTLIREMKEAGVSAIPVILSGYQEFEYAKQAIHLGVNDYLLKPIEMNELKECLESCRKRLKETHTPQNIYSFFSGNEPLNISSFTSGGSILICYFIFCTPLSNSGSLLHPVAGYISNTVIQDCFTSRVPGNTVLSFDGIFSNEKVVLLDFVGSPEETDRMLQGITAEFTERFGFPVTCYYMSSPSEVIGPNIQSAHQNCVRNTVLGVSRCCHTLPSPEPAENMTDLIELLTILLRQDDRDLIHSNLLRLCMKWKKEQRTIVASQADLIFILNALNQNFHDRRDRRIDSVFYAENIYCFSSSFEELASNFSLLLTELFGSQNPAEEQSLRGEELVEKIEDYFRNNLSHSLTLQLLADEMNVSKVHLCRVFKKYRNMTPIDSFNRMKIERARELLVRFTSLPLQKISDMLGFSDVYYFSKVFKKIEGTSPSAYRKAHS